MDLQSVSGGCLLAVFLGGITCCDAAAAEDQPAADTISAQAKDDAELSGTFGVSQLVELESKKKGQARYGFFINVPSNWEAYVAVTEVPQPRGYASGRFRIAKATGGEARVDLEFSYRPAEAKEELNALLSTARTIQYNWNATGCDHPPAAGSLFDVPLNSLAAADKKILLLDPNSEMAKIEQGYRLLLIIPKDANPKTAAEIEAIHPRGEITIQAVQKPSSVKPLKTVVEQAWNRQRGAIGTAYFKFRRIQTSAEHTKPLSPNEVDALFSDQPWTKTQKDVLPVISKLLTAEVANVLDRQSPRVFQCVGSKSIERLNDGRFRYHDGEIDIGMMSGNGQVNVARAGESVYSRTTLSEFQRLNAPASLDEQTNVRMSGDVLLIETGVRTITANPQTGFAYRIHTNVKGADREDLDLQFEPQTFRGGIVLPRLVISMSFSNRQLDRLDVISIEEARINEPFGADDYRVEIQPGTTVVDGRNAGPQGPRVYRVKQQIEDAATYFRENEPRRREPQ